MQNNLIEVRVVRKAIEAVDICSLDLASVSGAPLPPFSAGAHIDLHVGGFVRQYSLCNNPSERHRYQVAVLRDPQSRGGSAAIHDGLSLEQTLKISPPRNHFSLLHEAPHSLLLAAGVGITPILCMAERLVNSKAAFTMHYCTRSRVRTAFRHRIAQSMFAGAVNFHFDEDGPAGKFDLVAALQTAPPGTHLYTCGPAGFLGHVLQTARDHGWPEERLHYEYFSAAPSTLPQGAFEVCIASTGKRHVVAAGESVVEALAREGIHLPVSCGQGVCGTCLTGVLAGVPDHRDMFLTSEEQSRNDQFAPCCSRAHSASLTLDL
ncbi:PDR/VanB family oxidoreductase [Polaromonas sp. SM01]|uniref:PDR/VanB family oxidoreductase n=1 Tax=Polaromonas sp. SM01 TaxID=3085630 RepID=UPI002982320B|nr:PDR/VanB family oxidoreductase [Polaromonas sp. SM01]MDW5444810.1 PDR/VanB family oxidoreductase [Polaromonas sp. SM01]